MGDRGSILIVDSNEGFAAMRQESLEQEGDYRPVVAHSGSEALTIASSETFDLAIVDLGIDTADGLDGPTVARRLRARQNDLRLMLIPLEGDVLSEDVADLDVQSVLPKPFFLPDLPGLIEDALTQPLGGTKPPSGPEPPGAPEQPIEPEDQPPSDLEPADVPYAGSPKVVRELEDLAREINAEAVLVTDGEEVVASAGRLSTEILDPLAQLISESYGSSDRVAEVLGRERHRFDQSLEGGEYMVYSLTVAGDLILSAALGADVAMGIVRHRVRGAASRLRGLISITGT
ncbi:MAG: response regulator [Anaerolineae bacterium]